MLRIIYCLLPLVIWICSMARWRPDIIVGHCLGNRWLPKEDGVES
jgi:hypothetical protein